MEYNDFVEVRAECIDTFMSKLAMSAKKAHNVAVSDNGAVMYATTGKALLDLNFSVTSLRSSDALNILEMFIAAIEENPELAMKWLFYVRDIREGLGERRIFNVIWENLISHNPELFKHLVPMIPEYGRWDDILSLMGTPMETVALRTINKAIRKDMNVFQYRNGNMSLAAKWLPNVNSGSKRDRTIANKIAAYMGMPILIYRKTISALREYLDVVERKMSSNQWDLINYEHVPSRANMIYSNAFMRHDADRREAYLQSVLNGESKMNASVLYPHEIIRKITSEFGQYMDEATINLIIGMWENLKRNPAISGKVMVVADGSGSMKQKPEGQGNIRCLDICIALAIYFSEMLKGPYRDRVITFSMHPQMVDLSDCANIFTKVERMLHYCEVANTNIEGVFKLILDTAVQNKLTQDDIPDTILLMSDMQFDKSVTDQFGIYAAKPLFDQIQEEWAAAGYSLPKVCFWNISGRPSPIPMIENDMGVTLMSGYSPNNVRLIMSGKLDPYEALVEVLNGPRYEQITIDLDKVQ